MSRRTLALLAVCCVLTAAGGADSRAETSPRPRKNAAPPSSAEREADRKALTEIVRLATERADRAWTARDARLMFPADTAAGTDSSVVVRTPDGRPINRAANIADLQRRMDMTTRIDTMRTVVDSILFVAQDSAVVFSSQRFVRWMKLPEQPERQRISSVIHRQRFARTGPGWEPAGPVEELDPRARWADEEKPK
jgi:hypothetical protein